LTTDSTPPKIAGIGEVLWDVISDAETFGGAPANFTCHCQSLGAHASIVSSVGHDERGSKAVSVLNANGVDTALLTVNDYETGHVLVTFDKHKQPSFTIKEDVAWDYIPFSADSQSHTQSIDAVCFGTLGQRSATSRKSIQQFLSATRPDCLRIFDINLRPPFYHEEIIRDSIGKANILKLNDEELHIIAPMFGLQGSESDMIQTLLSNFDLDLVALTRGSKGSLIATTHGLSEIHGRNVNVADTVGAGDAFTAAMIIGFLSQQPLQELHNFASEVAEFVCTQPGAVPDLPDSLLSSSPIR